MQRATDYEYFTDHKNKMRKKRDKKEMITIRLQLQGVKYDISLNFKSNRSHKANKLND